MRAAARVALKSFQSGLPGGAVVPGRRQIAQRLEEGRCEQQDEQALRQREFLSPRTEIQLAKEMEADIDGDQRHAERSEQFQNRR